MGKDYRIVRVQRERFLARNEGGEIYCVLSGTMRYREEYPVVGDYVEVMENPWGDSLIMSVRPRRSVFCRPDRGGHAEAFTKTLGVQVLVANIDYVFIITSLNHDFSLGRIARYAAMALSGGAIPVAVLTKADLCGDLTGMENKVNSMNRDLKVITVSSLTGYGLDKLRELYTPGTTIALLGSSGAGKSTLVNTLAGREIMRTGEIRDDDSKGRHTTTHRELIDVDGVCFIDTPGLRELGVIDADEGIGHTFGDIADLTSRCAFSDCTHRTEPGCAVREAIGDGSLSRERWEMFLRLERENRWSKEKKKVKMMNIAIEKRKMKKPGRKQ